MRELFYEETSKLKDEEKGMKKFKVRRNISYVFFFLVVMWVAFLLLFLDLNLFKNDAFIICLYLLIYISPGIIFGVLGYVFVRLKNKALLSYDYTFLTDTVRISVIINNSKRKVITTFNVKSIEQIGKFGSETYLRHESSPNVKKKKLSANDEAEEGKSFYYFLVNTEEGKQLFIIETTETFIAFVLSRSSRLVLEKELK